MEFSKTEFLIILISVFILSNILINIICENIKEWSHNKKRFNEGYSYANCRLENISNKDFLIFISEYPIDTNNPFYKGVNQAIQDYINESKR